MNKIEERFTYQKPDEEDIKKYFEIREKAKELAYLLNVKCPEGRELEIAIEKLRESIMWANASIALKHLNKEV